MVKQVVERRRVERREGREERLLRMEEKQEGGRLKGPTNQRCGDQYFISHTYMTRARGLTDELWGAHHGSGRRVNGQVLSCAKIDDLELHCTVVLQHDVLRLSTREIHIHC